MHYAPVTPHALVRGWRFVLDTVALPVSHPLRPPLAVGCKLCDLPHGSWLGVRVRVHGGDGMDESVCARFVESLQHGTAARYTLDSASQSHLTGASK